MLKIGDFSQLGQVSVRTLRHYAQRGLLKPVETDDWTGYRFYSLEQLPRLNRILALKDLGFSLDQVAGLVEDDVPVEQLRGMLALRQAEIERQLTEDQARLMRVGARLKQIESEDKPSAYEVVLKKVAPTTVASLRTVVPQVADMPAYRCHLYGALYDRLARDGVEPSGPEMAVYHNGEYTEENVDMEVAVPVDQRLAPPGDGIDVYDLPAASEVASAVFRGDLWDILRGL